MAISRLDRIYLNDHQLEQFDREYRTVALDATPSRTTERSAFGNRSLRANSLPVKECRILPLDTRISREGFTWNSTA